MDIPFSWSTLIGLWPYAGTPRGVPQGRQTQFLNRLPLQMKTNPTLAKSDNFLLYKFSKLHLDDFSEKYGKIHYFIEKSKRDNLAKNGRIFKKFVPKVIYRFPCNHSRLWQIRIYEQFIRKIVQIKVVRNFAVKIGYFREQKIKVLSYGQNEIKMADFFLQTTFMILLKVRSVQQLGSGGLAGSWPRPQKIWSNIMFAFDFDNFQLQIDSYRMFENILMVRFY